MSGFPQFTRESACFSQHKGHVPDVTFFSLLIPRSAGVYSFPSQFTHMRHRSQRLFFQLEREEQLMDGSKLRARIVRAHSIDEPNPAKLDLGGGRMMQDLWTDNANYQL